MRKTPDYIFLTKDHEDPNYIIWQNQQPEDGVEYVKVSVVNKYIEKINKLYKIQLVLW